MTLFHMRPHSFVFFSNRFRRVSLGRPRLLMPYDVQSNADMDSVPGAKRHTFQAISIFSP